MPGSCVTRGSRLGFVRMKWLRLLSASVLVGGALVAFAEEAERPTFGRQLQAQVRQWLGGPSTVVGDLRIVPFTSKVFGNTRMLRVLLPEGYDAPENRERHYPVLYLNDGQSLFDSATAPSGVEWQVDETVQSLVRSGKIPPLIVVGIDNGGSQRTAEYLPYPHRVDPRLDVDPRGKEYPSFLIDEVMPFVNAHYRTSRSSDETGLGGSSLGGLVSVYTVLVHPGVFGRLLVESPTMHVDHEHILRDAAKVRRWPERVSLGIGTNEGGRPVCPPAGAPDRLVDDLRALAQRMVRNGMDSAQVRLVIDPCARHGEPAWRRRFPAALTFLFGMEGRDAAGGGRPTS